MKTNAFRFAAGLALAAFCAPFHASAQYFPPLIIVPPPAQDYAMPPKPARKPPPPAKPKPPDTPDRPTGHYQGRTYVPD